MTDIQHLPDSVASAMTQFESAVANISYHETIIQIDGETDEEAYAECKAEYQAARAALINILEEVV